MSAIENAGPVTLTAATALAENRGVKLSTISATYWAAGDTMPTLVGVTTDGCASAGNASVRGLIRGSIMRMTAGAAVSAGGAIYPAANGKVSSTAASGSQIGWALEAASGDGAELSVLVTV